MGDAADAILDGDICGECGELIEDGSGFCPCCADDAAEADDDLWCQLCGAEVEDECECMCEVCGKRACECFEEDDEG